MHYVLNANQLINLNASHVLLIISPTLVLALNAMILIVKHVLALMQEPVLNAIAVFLKLMEHVYLVIQVFKINA